MKKHEPLAYTLPAACEVSGFGKSSLYLAIAKNELQAKKMGSRTFILAEDLKAWLESKPSAKCTYTNA